jgi:hypothetical protein
MKDIREVKEKAGKYKRFLNGQFHEKLARCGL